MQGKNLQEGKIGLIYGLSAFVIWGFLVVFYKQFSEVSPYEIVAHRVIWSVVALFAVLTAMRRLGGAIKILLNRRISAWLFVSGWLVSSSWFIFVYAVDMGLVVEASLGNFICPLISIALGFFVLKEPLSNSAKFAVFIVFIAILVQVIAVGTLPVLAITLAVIVALYGLIRKQVKVPALEGLFVESLMTLPVALGYFFYLLVADKSGFRADLNGVLLVLCGPLTVVPLLLFTAAARRVSLSVMGYLQYINPTISMLLAVFIYGEILPPYKLASFCLIWFALVVLSLQGLAAYKRGAK